MIAKIITLVMVFLLALPATVASAAQPQRIVYFVNHTDSRFPVIPSVHDWNPAPRAQLRLTDTCEGKYYCADIYQTNLRRGYLGLTNVYRYPDGSIKYDVFLDTDRRSTERRRSIVCHELGHVLSIGHNGRGCMTTSPWLYPQHPGEHNLKIAR